MDGVPQRPSPRTLGATAETAMTDAGRCITHHFALLRISQLQQLQMSPYCAGWGNWSAIIRPILSLLSLPSSRLAPQIGYLNLHTETRLCERRTLPSNDAP